MDYFFLTALGFCSGVLLGSFISFGVFSLAFGVLCSLVFFLLYRYEKVQVYFYISLFILLACIGAGRTMLVSQELPSVFEKHLESNITFTGIVVSDPDIRDTNQHVAVEIADGETKTIVLGFAPLFPKFSYGEQVTISGTLSKPDSFDTDGGRTFNYRDFLAKDGIFAVIPRARITSIEEPSGFLTLLVGSLYNAKHTFVEGIRSGLPEPSAALAEGLLTGGKQGLGKDLIEAFTVAGLIQIVVLSGYNVMIVAEAVLRSLSFLPKRFAISVAGIAIVAFVIAAGSGSAALRAGLMACIALYARATGRTYEAIRGLFLALVLLTLWNPLYLAFDPGFQLSFIATLGLIVGTPLIEPKLSFIKSTLLRDVTATTIAAQIAVLPLLLYQTGNLSFVSILANVLVTPIIPITMALGFIAGVAGILVPSIAPVIALPAHAFLSYIVAVGEYAAAFPLAHAIVPAFPLTVVIVGYGGLFLLWRKLRT